MGRYHLAILAASMFAGAVFAVADEGGAAAPAETAAKSIVPSKYAGKYKNGGSDPVAEFIKSQSYENNEVVLDSFYSLCVVNGIAQEQIDKYKTQTDAKTQGASGRARMTLGNMLRSKARKDGKLLDQSGKEVVFEGLAKPAVSGAAAKAQADAVAQDGTTKPAPTGTEVDDADTTE